MQHTSIDGINFTMPNVALVNVNANLQLCISTLFLHLLGIATLGGGTTALALDDFARIPPTK